MAPANCHQRFNRQLGALGARLTMHRHADVECGHRCKNRSTLQFTPGLGRLDRCAKRRYRDRQSMDSPMTGNPHLLGGKCPSAAYVFHPGGQLSESACGRGHTRVGRTVDPRKLWATENQYATYPAPDAEPFAVAGGGTGRRAIVLELSGRWHAGRRLGRRWNGADDHAPLFSTTTVAGASSAWRIPRAPAIRPPACWRHVRMNAPEPVYPELPCPWGK